MSGVNKVILVGRLGKDPEVRYTTDQKAIANVSVATSETWKDKSTGEKKEKTEWHRVVFFGGVAQVVADYVKKGSQIYVEGKLTTRKWVKDDGTEQYTTEVVVDGFNGVLQMLDSKNQTPPGQQQQASQPQQPQVNDDLDGDIPF